MLVDNKIAFLFPDEIDKPVKVVFPDVQSCPIDHYIVCEHSKLKWDDMDMILYCELKKHNEENCNFIKSCFDLFE